MKWVKRGIAALVIVALFIICALVAVVIFVDPNDYKDDITSAVAEHTGRTLRIDGSIELSVFPWIGVELNKVSLDNPKGFSDKRFVEMERLNVKAALLPLLALKVRVGEIELIGLRVNAERRADGVTNWDDLTAAQATPSEPAGETESTPPAPAKPVAEDGSVAATPPIKEFYIGGINIRNANIIWRDATSNTLTRIESFNLKTDTLRAKKPSGFKMNFALRNEQPKVIAGVTIDGVIDADVAASRYGINDLRMVIKASGPVVPGNDQQIDLALQKVSADLSAETVQLDQLQISLAGAELHTSAQIKQFLGDKLQATGQMQVSIASLRNLMGQLEIPAPITAESDVLGLMTMQTDFDAGLDSLALNNIALVVDHSNISGNLSVQHFAQPALRFKLALDQLNADQYLPPPPETDVSEEELEKAPTASTAKSGDEEAQIELPVDMLKQLDVEGDLSAGSLQAMNVKLSNFATTVRAKSGKLDLNPLDLDLYGGQFRGNAGLDVNPAKPKYSAAFNLKGVQAGPLMQDYMKDRLIDGEMNAKADIVTDGTRISELMKQLNGTMDLAFKDGALSMNVREQLRNAKNRLYTKLGRKTDDTSKPLGEPTKFSSIVATTKIVDGVVNNNDLEVKARYLYVTGKGKFELPTNYLDYTSTILLSDDGAGQSDPLNEFYDLPIEYALKGKLEELDYAGAGLKALQSALEARGKRAVQEVKDKYKAAVDKQKAEAKAAAKKKKEAAKAKEREKLEKKKDEKKQELLKKLIN